MASNPAAGQHDGPRAHLHAPSLDPGDHPVHAGIAGEQRTRLCPVVNGDAGLVRRPVERIDQARAAAPRLDREPAPEPEAAVRLLEGLAAVARLEPDALAAQPAECGVAAGDQLLHQVRVGPVPGEPRHVVVVVRFAVGAEVGFRELAIREIGHQRAKRPGVVEHHAHRAGGIGAVAAPLFLWRRLQQAHARAGLRGRQCGRERGVAAAHDHDVCCQGRGHRGGAVTAQPAPARPGRPTGAAGTASAAVGPNEIRASSSMAR